MSNRAASHDFLIAAIGASAGGLTSIKQFLAHLTGLKGIALFIIQHLDPKAKSLMQDILKNFTSLPLGMAKAGEEIEPGRIYLSPPDKRVNLGQGKFQLMDFRLYQGSELPIDYFFGSLAREWGIKAIGIILSGAGSDGTLGVKAIKAAGGVVIAEDPKEAEYGDMPKSAIASGAVDFILAAEKMPEVLYRLQLGGLREEEILISRPVDLGRLAEQIMLKEFAPPSVVIDEDLQILCFLGTIEKYLTLPKGKTGEKSLNLLDLIREDLGSKVKKAIKKALQEKKPVVLKDLFLKQGEVSGKKLSCQVDLRVRPLPEVPWKLENQKATLVTFLFG